MNFDEMINLIAEEVLKRLKNPPKNALVVFTGGAIGFNESMAQIKKLKNDKWNLSVVLSKSAEYVLTPKLIKDSLGIDEVYLESEINGINELFVGVDTIILPTLTMNTAAKISLCISDTLATNIVSNAIMKGIEVVAVKDACDLENPTRLSLGYNKSPAQYINTMKYHMKIIKEYGIKLVDSYELYDSIIGNETSKQNTYVVSTNNPEIDLNRQEIYLNKKVVTREDVMNANQDIVVDKNTIITSLAKEVAGKIGVTITRKP